MAKNSKKNKGFSDKRSKNAPDKVQSQNPEDPAESVETEMKPAQLDLKTQIGGIDTELFDRLLKPAMISFSIRREEETLRQVIESIVTAIVMRDAYEGYRKLDDICQRYLYYFESVDGITRRTRESVELGGLCDYWRSQAMMMLVRDSAAIFELLLPDVHVPVPDVCTLKQEDFLRGINAILNGRLDAEVNSDRNNRISPDLYDFAYGMSFPWLGFDPGAVFSIQNVIPDSQIAVKYEFALASAEQTQLFYQDAQNALHECLFLDLLYAQHRKVYDEVLEAFPGEERLPNDFRIQLEQKIRFDKTYQTAFYDILCGIPLTKNLHRSSRIDFKGLNAFGKFVSVIRQSAENHQGVYIFHYLG
ncbi:MAG: hypothetical protein J6A01_00575 [Proteobacteria bacterium]|nr:hypothetical protein [Pseudomonadota bacterium]